MQTKVLIPDAGAYQLASDLLNRGELVAFPTETVYGLGALGMLFQGEQGPGKT